MIVNEVVGGVFIPLQEKLLYPLSHYRDQYDRDLLELAIISENTSKIVNKYRKYHFLYKFY